MSRFLFKELKSVVLGDWLGAGASRDVYASAAEPNFVIKCEYKAGSFQNIAEWDVWDWINDRDQAKWFAPCISISNCGVFLVQRRCEPLRASERPPKLPKFLCDLKRENFGILDGRVVCLDYGTVGSAIRLAPKNLVKANWRT
mgnify:CR=1 FL=1